MQRTIVAAALAAAFIAPATAGAADRNLTLEPGAASTATVTGATGNGLNVSFFVNSGPLLGTCGKDPNTMCESILVHVPEAQKLGVTENKVKFRLDGFTAASDFDLRVYDSGATGAAGTNLGSPRGDVADDETLGLGTDDPRHTGPGDFETKVVKPPTTIPAAGKYYLVYVPYFLVANDKYTLTVSWTKDAAF